MKAILVVDFPDGVDANDYYMKSALFLNKGERDFRYYEAGIEYFNLPLKPLPKKKFPKGSDLFNDYVNGYNDCIEDILE